ncbi:MAG TPA: hypothetical protein VGB53_10590 [Rubricoccaceae bacterium]|jgi:hypothetical protein
MYRFVFAAVLLSGCSFGSAEYTQADYEREADAARRDLEAAIGEARASDAGSCRMLSLGDRPCGGPAYFLPYSVTDSDTVQVATLAGRIAEIDRRANLALGLVSTCELRMPPPVELRDGRCQAQVRAAD